MSENKTSTQEQEIRIKVSEELPGFSFQIPKGTEGITIYKTKHVPKKRLSEIQFRVQRNLKRSGLVTITIEDIPGEAPDGSPLIVDKGIGTHIHYFQPKDRKGILIEGDHVRIVGVTDNKAV